MTQRAHEEIIIIMKQDKIKACEVLLVKDSYHVATFHNEDLLNHTGHKNNMRQF